MVHLCVLADEPLVLPVAEDFLKGSILHKGGGPTGSLLYEGLVTKNRGEDTTAGWPKAGNTTRRPRSGRSG